MLRSIAGTICAAAAALTIALGASPARAWEADYVKEAIDNGLGAAQALKDLSGYQPRSDGFCLVGGWLEKGGELAFTVNLKKGKEYIFVGGADEDAKDLDLAAMSGKELIAEDEDDDNSPVVIVEAQANAECTLRLKLFEASEPVFCVLMMLEGGGKKGSLDALHGVVTQLAVVVDSLGGAFQLDKGKGSISLVACLLEKGKDRAFLRPFSPKEEYVIVGSADDSCKDLDLSVTKDGDEVADDDDDATPVVHFQTEGGGRTNVKLTMFDAKRPSFAVAAILTKAE